MTSLDFVAFVCLPIALVLLGAVAVLRHESKNDRRRGGASFGYIKLLMQYPFQTTEGNTAKILALAYQFSLGGFVFSIVARIIATWWVDAPQFLIALVGGVAMVCLTTLARPSEGHSSATR
ncbi:MAG TPA: hypothetical protein VGO49_02235 [Bradyrhizobium sp.]|jgi:hypothetical protein|nr:hypothetical protein [Bradyrhizobium sp.]